MTKVVNEQVQLAQRQQRGWFNKQLVEIKELFSVPGIIGAHDVLQQRQGTEAPPFADFRTFVEGIYK